MRKSKRNCVAFPTLALILAFTENEIRKNVKVSSIFWPDRCIIGLQSVKFKGKFDKGLGFEVYEQ